MQYFPSSVLSGVWGLPTPGFAGSFQCYAGAKAGSKTSAQDIVYVAGSFDVAAVATRLTGFVQPSSSCWDKEVRVGACLAISAESSKSVFVLLFIPDILGIGRNLQGRLHVSSDKESFHLTGTVPALKSLLTSERRC